ncbi:MAG: aminopeptidase, partial [Fervidobacterium sp.]
MALKKSLVWKKRTREEIENFSSNYKEFIDYAKTERLAIRYFVNALKEAGFVNISEYTGKEKEVKGVFYVNHEKSLVAVKGDITK